jgi:outer membrane protein TolC
MRERVKMLVALALWGGFIASVCAQEVTTLDQLVAEALENNAQLLADSRSVSEQERLLSMSVASTMPGVGLGGGNQYGNATDTLTASVDVTVDISKLVANDVRSKSLLLDATRLGKLEAEALLVLTVKNDYYAINLLRQEESAMTEMLVGLRRSMEVTQRLVKAGLKSRIALFQIQDQIDSAEADLVLKRSSIREMVSGLAHILNRSDAANLSVADYSDGLPALVPLAEVLAQVADKSPSLGRGRLSVLAIKSDIHDPMISFLPALGLGVGYSQNMIPRAEAAIDFHVVGSIGLIDFGKAKSAQRYQTAVYETKLAESDASKLALFETVRSSYDRARLDLELYARYEQMLASNRQALEIATTEYSSGVLSEIELIDANKRTIDAEIKLQSVFYDYLMQYSFLQYCQGALR